jgi:HSP20 family molecular chaperone IbpA
MSILNNLIPSRTGGDPGTATPEAQVCRPRHEIREVAGDYQVTVYLPGVAKDAIEISDQNGELTVTAKAPVKIPEGVAVLHRETPDASFRLVVEHDASIDNENIAAELKDGVLTLKLVKSEAAKPRKIAIS